jgi:peptidoglycan/LPS O-acetylase OafA/YrhL
MMAQHCSFTTATAGLVERMRHREVAVAYASKAGRDYFPAVDFLRGLGALTILVWHYHNFYFTRAYSWSTTDSPVWNFDIQPLYGILWPFYHYGEWAVQFFWVLSGFVFAHVYANKATSGQSFFILRVSRLYPLHLITLLVITALQIISMQALGKFQIIATNDVYHFILHLFFASNWLPKSGVSFNSPVWSISIEEIAYWLFWILVARHGRFTVGSALGFSCIALLLLPRLGLLGQCFWYFFVGSAAYILQSRCRSWRHSMLLCAAGLILSLVPLAVGAGYAENVHFPGINQLVAWINYYQAFNMGVGLVFASVVVGAACLDLSGAMKKQNGIFLFVGSLTYSTYLWHLPLQVGVLVMLDLYGFDRAFFNHPATLLGFIGFMIVVGRASFLFIETPLKSQIRNRITGESRNSLAPLIPLKSSLPSIDTV